MQFPSLFPKPGIQQDSYAANLIEKAAENFEYLNGNPDYFNMISSELFSRVAFQLGTAEGEEALAEAKGYTDTFFDSYNPLIDANKKLDECQFKADETQFLEKEAPALLAFLDVIQKKCQEHLEKVPKEYAYITDKYKEINRSIQNPELKLKAHFPPAPLTPFEDETVSPSDVAEGDLVPLSSNLKELQKTREEMEHLKHAAEAMFQAISEWRIAKELGKTTELPPLEKFMELRDQIKAISRKELNFPPNLLQKATRCSRAAGRALEQIAEFSKRLNDQIQEIKKGLEDNFQEHLRDFNLWKLITQSRGKTPTAQDYIDQLNIDPLTLNHLKAIDWLHKLPETQLKNLERAFSDLSPSEKTHFKGLIGECSTPEEFFQRLSGYYDEKVKAAESQAQANNQALEKEKKRLQQEVQNRETRLSSLSAEKSELDLQIRNLKQQFGGMKKETLKESEERFRALEKQLDELTTRAKTLESEKSELDAQIQTLRQELKKTEDQHTLAQEAARRQIIDLETHCQNLQKELGALTDSKSKATALDAQNARLVRQISELGQKLEGINRTSKTQISDAQTKLESLQNEMDKQKGLIARFEKEKVNLEKQIDELNAQFDVERSAVQSRLDRLQNELEKQKALVASAEKEKYELQVRIIHLDTEHSRTERSIKRNLKDIESQKADIADLKDEKSALERHITDIKALSEENRRQLEEYVRLNADLQKDFDQVKDEFARSLDKYQKDLQEKESKIARSEKEREDLEKRMGELNAQLDKSEKERSAAQSRFDSLQSDLKQQKTVVAALEKDKAVLENQVRDLKERIEKERSDAQSRIAGLQNELEEQKRGVATSEREKAVLENRVRELRDQVETLEVSLQAQQGQVNESNSNHPYGRVLEKSVDLGDFLVNLQQYFIDGMQPENSHSVQPGELVKSLKAIHQTQGDAINWVAIDCMAEVMLLLFPQQLSFELLSQFIKYTRAKREIIDLEEKQRGWFLPKLLRVIQPNDFNDFFRSTVHVIEERKNLIISIESMMKSLSAVLDGFYSPLDKLSALYKILNNESSLIDYNKLVKFVYDDRDNTIVSIIFLDENSDINPWDNPGFFVKKIPLFSKKEVGYWTTKPECRSYQPATALPIYRLLVQCLQRSVPNALQIQLKELEKKMSSLDEDKAFLDNDLRDLNRTSSQKEFESCEMRHSKSVKEIDQKRKQLEESIRELTQKSKVVASQILGEEELLPQIDDLKKEIMKTFKISEDVLTD